MALPAIKLIGRFMFSILLKSMSYMNKTAFRMNINSKIFTDKLHIFV